jgi:hypothetical protein
MTRETIVFINGKLVTKQIDGVQTPEYLRLSCDIKTNPYANFGSDTLGNNVNGILNHADGKRYDSKSQYNRAVVASGCRVVGNDFNNAKDWQTPSQRGVRGDFNVRPQLKQALEQVLGC